MGLLFEIRPFELDKCLFLVIRVVNGLWGNGTTCTSGTSSGRSVLTEVAYIILTIADSLAHSSIHISIFFCLIFCELNFVLYDFFSEILVCNHSSYDRVGVSDSRE